MSNEKILLENSRSKLRECRDVISKFDSSEDDPSVLKSNLAIIASWSFTLANEKHLIQNARCAAEASFLKNMPIEHLKKIGSSTLVQKMMEGDESVRDFVSTEAWCSDMLFSLRNYADVLRSILSYKKAELERLGDL